MPKGDNPKSAQRHDGVHFVFTNYSRTWGLPWSMVNILSGIQFERIDLTFHSKYHLQIASWLNADIMSFPLLSASILSGLTMHRSCYAATDFVNCMCLENTASRVSSTPSGGAKVMGVINHNLIGFKDHPLRWYSFLIKVAKNLRKESPWAWGGNIQQLFY